MAWCPAPSVQGKEAASAGRPTRQPPPGNACNASPPAFCSRYSAATIREGMSPLRRLCWCCSCAPSPFGLLPQLRPCMKLPPTDTATAGGLPLSTTTFNQQCDKATLTHADVAVAAVVLKAVGAQGQGNERHMARVHGLKREARGVAVEVGCITNMAEWGHALSG
jgi:hypothetical protein